MFKNFCIAQLLRSSITASQLPDVLLKFVDVFTKTFCDDRSRGTLISDSRAFKTKFSVKPDVTSDAASSRRLSKFLRSAIQNRNADTKNDSKENLLGVAQNRPCSSMAKTHHTLEKDGILYKPYTTPNHKEPPQPSGTLSAFDTPNDGAHCGDSNTNTSGVDTVHCFIAFHNDMTSSQWSAGRIREILTHESQTLLVVDPFRALSLEDLPHDHYRMFPFAGGRIFYDEPESSPVIISPIQLTSHVALVQNVSTSIVAPHCLIIPLDRVSGC